MNTSLPMPPLSLPTPLPVSTRLSESPADLPFILPPEQEASEPPEERGLARDQVRLLVSHYQGDRITHTTFRHLPDFLNSGDVLVINTSGTRMAALNATLADGSPIQLHLSTHLPDDLWVVELRQPHGRGTKPFLNVQPGLKLQLPQGASTILLSPYQNNGHLASPQPGTRLWLATLETPQPLDQYLASHGFPIRYSYVPQRWPGEYYQTVYATETGSAEMPSAGRPFTPQVITRLVARGVLVVPLLLHTGVASLEAHEAPYPEYYRVPASTARVVNAARLAGNHIVAVGTTVVRALETVTDEDGLTHPGAGWTELVITPQHTIRAVSALLTGLHEPKATHLAMLQSLTGLEHLKLAYSQALEQGYLWHEFGDLHLLLP